MSEKKNETTEKKTPLFTKILVEIKGQAIVNIKDLPKEQYEQFLSLMEGINLTYKTIITNIDERK